MSLFSRLFTPNSDLTLLDVARPGMRADYDSGPPTGISPLPSMSDVEAWEQILIGVRSNTGVVVTPEKAKRCSAVLACIRGLSEDVSTLPCVLYKRGKNGDERAEDHVVSTLIDSAPNDIMTPMELREHIMLELILWGNFFVLKNLDPATGDIESLWPLEAQYVTRRWREMVYTFTDPTTGFSGTFPQDLVWRGSIMSSNGIDGVALTLLAREAIGLMLAAEEQGALLFRQGIQTDLSLTTDETMDADQKKQLRAALMQRHAGVGSAWMPLLLEGGLKAERIGLTAQESQYIEARGFQINDVARVFRYPEVLLGSTGKSSRSATYASAEQFFQSYTKHTLTPWAVRLEQTMQRDLLTVSERRRGYFIKHDFSSLLRADTAGRYAAYATGISSGFLSPADCRKGENLPYVPGLDYYTKPMNQDAQAGPDASMVKPTDQSGAGELPRRVAEFVIRKEQKGLAGPKADPAVFYAHFVGFVEDLTGADVNAVLAYVEMRAAMEDRFSPAALAAAIDTLISLCKKDK